MKKFGRLTTVLTMLLTLSLILGACGGDNGGNPTPTATSGTSAATTPATAAGGGKSVTVEAQDFQFAPSNITINVGDSITFVNKGGTAHTAQATDGSFDSGNLDPGATFSHTFTAAGTVKFYCKYHGKADGSSGMVGTITVQAGSSSSGNAAATPTTAAVAAATDTTAPVAAVATNTTAAPAATTAPTAGGTSAQGGGASVELQDYKFVPATLSINAGDSINFVNKGAVAHTATAGDSSWDSGNLDAGQSFSHTFATAGSFVVYCRYHGSADGKGMAMTITVAAGAGTAGGTTPTAGAVMTATQSGGGYTTGAADSLSADDQAAGSTVVVKHIHANQDGFVTIHANTADNKPGAQLGHTAIKQGDNDNVVVQVITATQAGDKVWPMLHIDAGVIGTYEFPGPDAPVIISGNIVMQQITITASAANQPSVAADDQPASASITVKKIFAAQDGWITIHANTATNQPGDQIGHTLIKAGENDNVAVLVSPAPKAGDKVWPMLHIDAGTIGTYEFPGPDAPVIVNGNIVMLQITLTNPVDIVQADDQPAGSTVVVKHIYANQDGFITVHANTATNQPGDQLGHAAVKKGDNDNVVVQISPATKAGDKVWPMLHIDAGVIGTYEFPGPDAPVIINGNIVMQEISITTAPVVVEELDNKFSATDITINTGDTIMFVNKGTHAHTATAGNGSWDSGNLDPGASFSHTFTTPGVFIVYCRYHGSADGKGMATAVTVVAGPTPTP